MDLVLLVFWHATKLWQLKIVILHNVADFRLFFCLHPSCSLVHPMHRLLFLFPQQTRFNMQSYYIISANKLSVSVLKAFSISRLKI